MTFRICHGFTNPAMEEKDTRWSAVLESKGLLQGGWQTAGCMQLAIVMYMRET
jgi:hypothetical protein